MARVNYKFEKRQKDLAKQKKKEEKLQKKLQKDQNPGEEGVAEDGLEATEGTEGEEAAPEA